MLKPEQCRGARGVLGWSQLRLAEEAGISLKTIQNFEHGKHAANNATIAMLRTTLETAGISFAQGTISGSKQEKSAAQKKQSDSVDSSAKQQINEEKRRANEAKLRAEIRQNLLDEVTREVSKVTRAQAEHELRPLIKAQVIHEMREEISRELRNKIREEMLASLPSKNDLRDEVKNEVRFEIEKEVRREVEGRIRNEVTEELKSRKEPVENDRVKLRTALETEIRESLGKEIRKEVWAEAFAEGERKAAARQAQPADEAKLRQTLRAEIWQQAFEEGKRDALKTTPTQALGGSRSAAGRAPAPVQAIVREHVEQAVMEFAQAIVAQANEKLGLLIPRGGMEQIVDNLVLEAPSPARNNATHRVLEQVRQAADKLAQLMASDAKNKVA